MKDQRAEAEQQSDFDQHQDQAAAGQRQQKIRAAHGRADEAFEQFALPHLDQRKTDTPHGRVHGVHPKHAGNQEIDIARAWFAGSDRGGRESHLCGPLRIAGQQSTSARASTLSGRAGS